IDYSRVAAAYAEDVRTSGGELCTGYEVVAIRRGADAITIGTTQGDVSARAVIACAGLYADRIAALAGAPRTPRIVPFRGDYYVLRPERHHLVRHLLYPVPDPAFRFL